MILNGRCISPGWTRASSVSILSSINLTLPIPLAPATGKREGRSGREAADILYKSTIVLVAGIVLILSWVYEPSQQAVEFLWRSMPGRCLVIFGTLYGLLTGIWCFWRLWLAIRYRPFPLVGDNRLPQITVVVPAYNEGSLVRETLRSLARSHYPRDRLEIIIVDDGSDDDTWSHIEAAASEIGPLITPIKCPVNRGKRWALWEGFRRAKGDVFVTVDSDSLVENDALRALVSPTVTDGRIGAVAGNVRVLNRDEGLIPRMMAVRYVKTFDYKRAAQSMMGGAAPSSAAPGRWQLIAAAR